MGNFQHNLFIGKKSFKICQIDDHILFWKEVISVNTLIIDF